jgi:hypothetical protein
MNLPTPLCSAHPQDPVTLVLNWMAIAGIEQGALFRRIRKGNTLTAERLTDQSVARVIKKPAARRITIINPCGASIF